MKNRKRAGSQMNSKPNAKPRTPKRKKSRFALIERTFPGRKFVEFPQMKGRTVEMIELFTAGEYHCICVRFQDKTALNLAIDLGFTLKADYDDWKTGDGRRIKGWPPIVSEGMRLP
jgi:hypothetical protein